MTAEINYTINESGNKQVVIENPNRLFIVEQTPSEGYNVTDTNSALGKPITTNYKGVSFQTVIILVHGIDLTQTSFENFMKD